MTDERGPVQAGPNLAEPVHYSAHFGRLIVVFVSLSKLLLS